MHEYKTEKFNMTEFVVTDLTYNARELRAAALFADGQLEELEVERRDEKSLVDSVFCGIVDSVNRNIGGAFVNIGKKEVVGAHSEGLVFLPYRFTGIHTLSPSQKICVQITKDAADGKQPVAADEIRLGGEYVMLFSRPGRLSFSKKLSEEQKEIIKKWIPVEEQAEFHIVARTRAGHADKQAVLAELRQLKERLRGILRSSEKAKRGDLLYHPEPFYVNMVKGLYEFPDRIYTDIPIAAEELKKVLIKPKSEDNFFPEMSTAKDHKFAEITWSEEDGAGSDSEEGKTERQAAGPGYFVRSLGGQSLAEHFNLVHELDKLAGSRIFMKSGAFLIIEQTAAFVVIDVNSGSCKKGRIPEETYRKVNLEAADEILRQLRLRNLSGEILIDFIKLRTEDHRTELLNVMKKKAGKEHVPTEVVDMTSLGIMEMVRTRRRHSLRECLTG